MTWPKHKLKKRVFKSCWINFKNSARCLSSFYIPGSYGSVPQIHSIMLKEPQNTGSVKKKKTRLIAYWVVTAMVAWELAFGATWDFNLVNHGYVHNIMMRLGYPDYIAYILGAGKVLGCIAVLVPGFGRLKEWAYAGTFFNFAGALASHLLAGDQPVSVIAPVIFGALTMASWWLRPASRKLASSTTL